MKRQLFSADYLNDGIELDCYLENYFYLKTTLIISLARLCTKAETHQ